MKYKRLKGYKYLLAELFAVHLIEDFKYYKVETPLIGLSDCWLTIKPGYAWDGASGPAFDSRDFMRGALVHDCLYQLIREKHLPSMMRRKADEILYRICREDGMPWWRASYVYRMVRWFGEKAAQPREEEPFNVVIEI